MSEERRDEGTPVDLPTTGGPEDDLPEGEVARALWRQTEEYKKLRSWCLIGTFLSAGVGALAFIWISVDAGVARALGAIAFLVFLTTYALVLHLSATRRDFYRRHFLKQRGILIEETADALLDSAGDPASFVAFWRASNLRLESYHAEASSQLRNAYRLAQFSAGAGFLLVLVLGIVAAFASSAGSSAVIGRFAFERGVAL